MPLTAGDVLLIYCNYIKPPHDKFCVCICPKRRWFFFINSEPRRANIGQVAVLPRDLACLDHKSYIDTSKILTFSSGELSKAQHKEGINPTIRLKIRLAVQAHGVLQTTQAQVVGQNLG